MLFKHILLTYFVLISLNINAQFFDNEEYYFNISDTPIRTKKLINNTDLLNSYLFQYNLKKHNIIYIIPVKFWIIKNKKKTIGPSELKKFIQYLNYYYSINNTGIRFSLRPDYQYINKEKLLNLRYYLQAPFQSLKIKSKACINVIIVNKLVKKKLFKSKKKKYAGTYNPISHGIIISGNISTSTLSHEIGHYLGLKHPHRGWKYKWFQEPVSRTRLIPGTHIKMCERRGDRLCDTPAEPNLTKYTDNKCNYTGWNVKDKYGETYKPDTHNIMSYTYNRECRNKFTKQQIALMLYTLSKNKYSKYWKIQNNKNQKFFPDAFEPDNHQETATEIFFNTPQIHSFHKTFTGRKKIEIPDTTDWLFFELKTQKPQTIIIKFPEINNLFPEIKISVFKGSNLITEKKLTDKSYLKELKIIKAIPGEYFIKIRQIVETERENFYKISLFK